jgi:hypothetical protein
LKPAPVEGGRAPFVLVRTEGEPGTEGAGFNLRPGLFPGRTQGEHCTWLQPGVRSPTGALGDALVGPLDSSDDVFVGLAASFGGAGRLDL